MLIAWLFLFELCSAGAGEGVPDRIRLDTPGLSASDRASVERLVGFWGERKLATKFAERFMPAIRRHGIRFVPEPMAASVTEFRKARIEVPAGDVISLRLDFKASASGPGGSSVWVLATRNVAYFIDERPGSGGAPVADGFRILHDTGFYEGACGGGLRSLKPGGVTQWKGQAAFALSRVSYQPGTCVERPARAEEDLIYFRPGPWSAIEQVRTGLERVRLKCDPVESDPTKSHCRPEWETP